MLGHLHPLLEPQPSDDGIEHQHLRARSGERSAERQAAGHAHRGEDRARQRERDVAQRLQSPSTGRSARATGQRAPVQATRHAHHGAEEQPADGVDQQADDPVGGGPPARSGRFTMRSCNGPLLNASSPRGCAVRTVSSRRLRSQAPRRRQSRPPLPLRRRELSGTHARRRRTQHGSAAHR